MSCAEIHSSIIILGTIMILAIISHVLLRKKSSSSNIFIIGPPSSGKTTLFYKLLGVEIAQVYSSLKKTRATLSVNSSCNFLAHLLASVGGNKKILHIHDVPALFYSSNMAQNFLQEIGVNEQKNPNLYVLTIDGTQLLNLGYLDKNISVLVDFIGIVKKKCVKSIFVLAVTRAKHDLCMDKAYAREVLSKKVQSIWQTSLRKSIACPISSTCDVLVTFIDTESSQSPEEMSLDTLL